MPMTINLRYGYGCALALALAACSADGTDLSAPAPTDTGETSFDDNSGETEAPQTTGGSSGTDTDVDPSSTTSSGPDGTSDTEEGSEYCPCSTVDCGAGTCKDPEETEDGMVQCVCDDGAEQIGLRCFVCDQAGSAVHDVNLDVQLAQFGVRLDGGAPSPQADENARLYLRDIGSGDRVFLGDTRDAEVAARILSSVYEIVYEYEISSSQALPLNRHAVLGRVAFSTLNGKAPLDESQPPIEITTVRTQRQVLFNGQPPVPKGVDAGNLFLRDEVSGDEVPLGTTATPTLDVTILKGEYSVWYEALDTAEEAPVNTRARVLKSVTPNNEALAIDLAVASLGINLKVDGSDPPTKGTDYGVISLRDTDTDERFVVGDTREGVISAKVLAGTYDVYYDMVQSQGGVPVNRGAQLAAGVVISTGAAEPLSFNLITVNAAGSFTLNDVPPPPSPNDDGVVTLEHPTLGVATLGNTHALAFSARVLPGTYAKHYHQETAGALVPVNTNARFGKDVVVDGTPFIVNIPTVEVSGTISVDGGAAGDFEDGRIYLRNQETGDSAYIGSVAAGAFTKRIIPGTYDLHYALEAGGEVVPQSAGEPFIKGLVIDGDLGGVAVDVPVVHVTGDIKINMDTPPSDPFDSGSLFLVGAGGSGLVAGPIYLGSTKEGSYSRRVTPGTYHLIYRVDQSETLAPANESAVLDCITVEAAP